MSSSLVFSVVRLTDPPHVFLPSILVKNDQISGRKRNGFCFDEEEAAGESSESSSIGVDDSSASSSSSSSSAKDEDKEEEVQSTRKDDGAFSSLESIEDSLPIKRGLSNFFSGKSKSFASLSEMGSTAADLAKSENPFNKRRRILMAGKARRASYSSLVSTYLPPLLSPDNAVLEEGDEEEEEKKGESSADAAPSTAGLDGLPMSGKMKKSFRSPRSFSLSDLQHA